MSRAQHVPFALSSGKAHHDARLVDLRTRSSAHAARAMTMDSRMLKLPSVNGGAAPGEQSATD